MATIRTKRVYDNPESTDGFRVLADRLWPRGMKKEYLHYDLWAKFLAPSVKLRQWYHADPERRWTQFQILYREELARSTEVAQFAEQIRQYDMVTLLYAAKDSRQNHASVLQHYLQRT